MQVIIPMSGQGQRFVDAGYTTIKPLIEVDGKPIIEYVIDLFSAKDTFVFVVNEDHIITTNIKEVLLAKVPQAIIVTIPSHKLGPVFAVQQAYASIDDKLPCIVNYCDFFMKWNYQHFLQTITDSGVDGAIPSYIGFHPHLLHNENVYAGCLVNDDNKLLAIKEKFSFTDNKFNSHHSVGIYYFKTGGLLKYYCNNLVANKHSLNGEYYASMVYEQMLKENKNILVYDKITHFCQWGTPNDLQEFNWWSSVFQMQPFFFESLAKASVQKGNLLMPMAGNGQRFVDVGYTTTKPLILVDDLPMYKKALSYLPKYNKNIFIAKAGVVTGNDTIIEIEHTTAGQAITCLLAEAYINNDKPLMITPCDNGMLYNSAALEELQQEADVIIFTFKGAIAVVKNPAQYGWVVVDEDRAKRVSCKQQISNNPLEDNAVTGAFWFKRGSDFVTAAKKMIAENRRINNEFYVDECINDCINAGFNVRIFEIDKYICWGTPNDLFTYTYWRTYFNQ